MSQLTKFLILILFVSCASCTTMFLADSSQTQTEVFYINQKTGEKKLIGATPLQISMEDLKSKVGEDVPPGEFFRFRFEKKGFQTETLLVPSSRLGTIATKLSVTMIENKKDDEEKVAKSLIDRLFTAQRLALLKEFERAQIEIDKIIADHPSFVRALTMRASIYYAQNNIPESIKWYEEALKIDPQMEDVIRMIGKLKGEKPVEKRLPARSGP